MKDSKEPYDYKFVKWMIKNKVMFTGFCNIVLYIIVNLWRKPVDMLWKIWAVVLFPDILLTVIWKILFIYFYFLATLHSMWDLSSLTRDWTHAPCSGTRVLSLWKIPVVLIFVWPSKMKIFKNLNVLALVSEGKVSHLFLTSRWDFLCVCFS